MTQTLDLTEETINNSSIGDLMFSIADIAMDERMAALKVQLRNECNMFLQKRLREIKKANWGEPNQQDHD